MSDSSCLVKLSDDKLQRSRSCSRLCSRASARVTCAAHQETNDTMIFSWKRKKSEHVARVHSGTSVQL